MNFYTIPDYGIVSLSKREQRAEVLIENHMSLRGLCREYVLRTFGVSVANEIYPQFSFENQKGTSNTSDYATLSITKNILNHIQKRGYILEKDINNKYTGRQWKVSIQEILDLYGLQRVRLNKNLKEQFNIKSKGYGYVIIPSQIESEISNETRNDAKTTSMGLQ